MDVIDDLDTARRNAATTFRTKRDEAAARYRAERDTAEDPRNYPMRRHHLALAEAAQAEAQQWELLRACVGCGKRTDPGSPRPGALHAPY
jgi:hypothetical protein